MVIYSINIVLYLLSLDNLYTTVSYLLRKFKTISYTLRNDSKMECFNMLK